MATIIFTSPPHKFSQLPHPQPPTWRKRLFHPYLLCMTTDSGWKYLAEAAFLIVLRGGGAGVSIAEERPEDEGAVCVEGRNRGPRLSQHPHQQPRIEATLPPRTEATLPARLGGSDAGSCLSG